METTLLKEVIEALKQTKRPELVDVTIYGKYSPEQRQLLYSDANMKYELHTSKPCDKEVRSVNAFVAIIKEELLRRENETGNMATVKLDLNGGYFIPDDNFGEEMIKFQRLNSQQWNLIKNGINTIYNHKGFLQFLQQLAPSFDNFQEIFKRFSVFN